MLEAEDYETRTAAAPRRRWKSSRPGRRSHPARNPAARSRQRAGVCAAAEVERRHQAIPVVAFTANASIDRKRKRAPRAATATWKKPITAQDAGRRKSARRRKDDVLRTSPSSAMPTEVAAHDARQVARAHRLRQEFDEPGCCAFLIVAGFPYGGDARSPGSRSSRGRPSSAASVPSHRLPAAECP